MSLKDALKAGPVQRVVTNKIDAWRQTLDDGTRAAFDAAALDADWPTETLARTISTGGFSVDGKTLGRYRARLRSEASA